MNDKLVTDGGAKVNTTEAVNGPAHDRQGAQLESDDRIDAALKNPDLPIGIVQVEHLPEQTKVTPELYASAWDLPQGVHQIFIEPQSPINNDDAETAAVEAAFAAFDDHDAPVDKGYLGDACRAYHRIMSAAPDKVSAQPPPQTTEALNALSDAMDHIATYGLDLISGGAKAWRKLEAVRQLLECADTSMRSPEGIPGGFDVSRKSSGDIIVTRLSDMGAATYKHNSSLVTEVMSWLFFNEILTSNSQPDSEA